MARRLADLRPFRLVVQMAFFTNAPVEPGMRRDIFNIGNRPTPNNPSAVLNVLLVTNVTIKLVVRTLLPRSPRGRHQMA